MGLRRFQHCEVDALTTGRYDLGVTSRCTVYRLGETVIDTGPPNQWQTVRRFLSEHTVSRVLLTHHHEDHSGNGAAIRDAFGAEVRAASSAAPFLSRGWRLRPYQRIIWGRPERFVPEGLPEEIRLSNGLRLRPLATPGHSVDSTCFLEPDRGWLFTGDLYVSRKLRYLRIDEDLNALIRSLARIGDLQFDTLFCAHRGVVADGRRAIAEKLEFLVALRDRVRGLAAEGHTPRRIAREVLGREGWMTWVTGFHFSKRRLVEGCLEPDPG